MAYLTAIFARLIAQTLALAKRPGGFLRSFWRARVRIGPMLFTGICSSLPISS